MFFETNIFPRQEDYSLLFFILSVFLRFHVDVGKILCLMVLALWLRVARIKALLIYTV